MELPPIIGITGPARSGKDTLAQHLVEAYRYQPLALAAPLKRGLRAMFPDVDFEGDDKDKPLGGPYWELDVTPRRLMQTLGTEWGRHTIHNDVWVAVLHAEITRNRKGGNSQPVVITDVRFENEASYIRHSGGVLVHLHRPGVPSVETHVSEAGVGFNLATDWCVVNTDGQPQLMRRTIDRLIGAEPVTVP